VRENEPILIGERSQDDLYRDAAEKYGASLDRLASAYEADPDRRRDLSQDIHFQLWRSFQRYDARCSLRTWIYRVAHNVAASYVMRERRNFSTLVSLEELEMLPDKTDGQLAANQRIFIQSRLPAPGLIDGLIPYDGPIGSNSRSRRYFRIADDTPKRRLLPVRTRRCAVTPVGTFPYIIRT
jgi:RNA polymerase sigma-70 factor (ECF subfamily)